MPSSTRYVKLFFDTRKELIKVKEGGKVTTHSFGYSEKKGKWKTVEILGKMVTPVAGYFDRASICSNPIAGGSRVASNLFTAGVNYFWKKDLAGTSADLGSPAAKTSCIALLVAPAGYAGCLACCGGTKYFGV